MREFEAEGSWVVYQFNTRGPGAGRGAVCGRAEWDRMEAGRPGFHTLVELNIDNECRAEALARAATGYVPPLPRGSQAARPAAVTP